MCCGGLCECLSDICLIIISVLFPPLPVWIRRGICSGDSLISILLCFLGYFPGLIYSWYIIAKYPPYTVNQHSKIYYIYHNDLEAQNQHQSHHHHHHHHHRQQPQNHQQLPIISQPGPSQGPSYGATNDQTNPPPYTEVDKAV